MQALLVVMVTSCLVAASAAAQTPTSGKNASSWKCSAPKPTHAIPVPDAAGHAYVVSTAHCTALKGEIAGVADKEGTTTEFMEVMGNTGNGHGIFVETLANGDKLTVSYEFTGTLKNNLFESGTNKWKIAGGTGMLKGATGQGTCTAKGNADGSANIDCTGSYALAK